MTPLLFSGSNQTKTFKAKPNCQPIRHVLALKAIFAGVKSRGATTTAIIYFFHVPPLNVTLVSKGICMHYFVPYVLHFLMIK